MLHLAIIHEEEVIAQQLIQLFPKEVLDIQNNLYQVSVDIVALLFPAVCDFLLISVLIAEAEHFQRTLVPLYFQSASSTATPPPLSLLLRPVREVTVSGGSSGTLNGNSPPLPPVEIEPLC